MGRLKTRSCGFEDGFPLRLHFTKRLFAQVTRIAPAVCKLVQSTQLGAPVVTFDVGRGPGFDFVHQGHSLGAVLGRVFFHLFQPGQNSFIGIVASGVKALPQSVVGQAALVGLLPAVTQLAQFVLHLAATHRGGFFGIQQRLSLGHQILTNLVCTPALPAFVVACGRQCVVHALVQCGVEILAVGLEHGVQSGCGIGWNLAFCDLFFKRIKHIGHGLVGLLAQGLSLGRVHLGFSGFGLFARIGGTRTRNWRG